LAHEVARTSTFQATAAGIIIVLLALRSLLLHHQDGKREAKMEQEGRGWRHRIRHLGSTVALILGCLELVTGLSQFGTLPTPPSAGGALLIGTVMILGALAYRSAKKRKLGEVKSTGLRQAIEVTLLLLIAMIILLQNDIKYLIATDPVPNAVIPAWAIIAYLIVVSTSRPGLASRGG
jgi:hypothetical protein